MFCRMESMTNSSPNFELIIKLYSERHGHSLAEIVADEISAIAVDFLHQLQRFLFGFADGFEAGALFPRRAHK